MRNVLRTMGLFVLWVALSGHLEPFLLSVGLLASLLVSVVTGRMRTVDPKPPAILPGLPMLTYLPWLIVQVIRSNLDMARRILSPSLPISPCVVEVRASQRTALGRATYANSITLTPGTVSIDLEGDTIRVHAIGRAQAEEVRSGAMDRRVSAAEGPG